ncbi:MAG TPA: ATP-binding protein [Desulfobacterales bacterium]|nr:ATP-binding protein [Desulfobacterales bacterium]
MRELSLHILDVVENGITAGAGCIAIAVDEALAADRLTIRVADDGRGMPAEKALRIEDPFVTTRTTRRVGLGLSLLAAAARRCEGELTVATAPGRGTEITATFRRSHIDRAPLGDMAATLEVLIVGNPQVDFVYSHRVDDRDFTLDTRELRRELAGVDLGDPAVARELTESIRRALHEMTSAATSGQGRQPDGEAHD